MMQSTCFSKYLSNLVLTTFLSVFLIICSFASASAQASLVQDFEDRAKVLDQTVSILIRISTPPQRTDESLASARIKFQDLLTDTSSLTKEIEERLTAVSERLNEIGAAPSEDAPEEDLAVKEARQSLTTERSKLAVIKSSIEATVLRAREQISTISVRRQNAFTNAIFQKTPLSSTLYTEAITSARSVFASATTLFSNWVQFIVNNKLFEAIGSILFALVFALFFRIYFYRLFSNYLYNESEEPDYFTKLFYAFWATVLPSAAIAIFLYTIYGLFNHFEIYASKTGEISFAVILLITGAVFAWNLSKAIFAPDSPNWRLIKISNKAARKMFWLTFVLLVVQGIDYLFQTANQTLSGTVEQTALQGIIAAIVIGGILIWMALIKPYEKEFGTYTKEDWAKWFSIPMILIGGAIILSSLSGYIGLGRFISQQVIVTGAIIALMVMGILAARELSKEGVLGSTSVGRFMSARMGMESLSIEQVSLGGSIAFIASILSIGVPAILLQWGTTSEEIWSFVKRAFTGFDIGSVRFSLSGILFGIFIFIIGVILTRIVKRWLRSSVFPRVRADVGVRDSISAGLGYLGYGLAGLFAVTAAGVDLSNLALVAGALSLGIGFGLQNVVSNFVSGLILLIERPIKVGDWIVVGSAEGTVKRISVRATEIETFQRKSIIIPNSELINSQVGNWTFKSKSGRIDIPIGVGYGSDVKLVEKTLYEIAANHEMVAKKPEVNVWFKGFGDSSLDFSLRMHLYDINNTVTVESEVRFQIVQQFEELGIEIPFPQRDINVNYQEESPKEKALKAPPRKVTKAASKTSTAKKPVQKRKA